MLSWGGSRSGRSWLFADMEYFCRVLETYRDMAETAGGVTRCFRVPGCCSALFMLVIGYGGNTAA